MLTPSIIYLYPASNMSFCAELSTLPVITAGEGDSIRLTQHNPLTYWVSEATCHAVAMCAYFKLSREK